MYKKKYDLFIKIYYNYFAKKNKINFRTIKIYQKTEQRMFKKLQTGNSDVLIILIFLNKLNFLNNQKYITFYDYTSIL